MSFPHPDFLKETLPDPNEFFDGVFFKVAPLGQTSYAFDLGFLGHTIAQKGKFLRRYRQ